MFLLEVISLELRIWLMLSTMGKLPVGICIKILVGSMVLTMEIPPNCLGSSLRSTWSIFPPPWLEFISIILSVWPQPHLPPPTPWSEEPSRWAGVSQLPKLSSLIKTKSSMWPPESSRAQLTPSEKNPHSPTSNLYPKKEPGIGLKAPNNSRKITPIKLSLAPSWQPTIKTTGKNLPK